MGRFLIFALCALISGCFLFRPLHRPSDFPEAAPALEFCFSTESGMTVYAADGLKCPRFASVQGAEFAVAKLTGVDVDVFNGVRIYWVRGRINCNAGRPVPGCTDLTRGVALVSATYREVTSASPSFGAPLAEYARPLVTLRHELGHFARPDLDCRKGKGRRLFHQLESAR